MQTKLIIGTRGSPLALIQAQMVASRLYKIHGKNKINLTIKTITTGGDKSQTQNLSMIESTKKYNNEQNKFGLFSKEIELELLKGKIDFAVHSAKDMVSTLPDGLKMDIFIKRENIQDGFLSLKYNSIMQLPKGAIIGTSSIRRRAQILRFRKDIKFVEFRGNIETRLKKLENNIADGTILALAGLKRLKKDDKIREILDLEKFPPAPAQGAIGIEYRKDDKKTASLLAPLNHQQTYLEVNAERSFLREIDGSCRTPIACFAKIEKNEIIIYGQIFSPNLQYFADGKVRGDSKKGEILGKNLAKMLLSKLEQIKK